MEPKKTIYIGDKAYFSTFIWKRVLRKDLEDIKDSQTAIIPLYSANVHKPFWFVEKSNISDFSSPSILWWIDGDFDFSIQDSGNIFATTDHCGCIKILDTNIYPWYLLYILRIAKTLYNFDRSLRSNLENISKIEVSIPVKENWEFDSEKQKEIAQKYEKLEKIKDRIRIMREDIEGQRVQLSETFKGNDTQISTIFDLKRWDSKYTRKYGSENSWSYPVYSAGQEQLTSIDTFDFDGQYLTWSTNGFAWYLKKIDWKFSINSDRWVFVPLAHNVDIDFVRYSIQSDLRNLTKWRVWDKWKNEFTKLSPDKIKANIVVKIPTLENWDFHIEKQKEIAQKYEKIEKMKNDLMQELEYLESVKVEI